MLRLPSLPMALFLPMSLGMKPALTFFFGLWTASSRERFPAARVPLCLSSRRTVSGWDSLPPASSRRCRLSVAHPPTSQMYPIRWVRAGVLITPSCFHRLLVPGSGVCLQMEGHRNNSPSPTTGKTATRTFGLNTFPMGVTFCLAVGGGESCSPGPRSRDGSH